jgi:hypothetical protein
MSTSKLLLAALALAHLTCASVPLTAPSGSSLTVFANPEFVPANGGVSAVIATVVEPAGTFVPDGTVVFFVTNLGRIDAEAKTKDGFARVNFVSDSRSGIAHVTAFSGGSAPTPTTTPTPAATATAMATTTAAASGTPVAGAGIENFVDIHVGSSLPTQVIVTAYPARITEPRNSEITANVRDAQGNPVANVPVIFKIDSVTGGSGLLQESLDSGSQPRFTDTNGQARDTLRTSQNRADLQKRVTVTASVPGVATDQFVDVFIN